MPARLFPSLPLPSTPNSVSDAFPSEPKAGRPQQQRARQPSAHRAGRARTGHEATKGDKSGRVLRDPDPDPDPAARARPLADTA